MQNKVTRTKVFIVDDDAQMVELLGFMVSRAGLEWEGFTSAAPFIEIIHNLPLHSLVILDLHMPGFDGIEVMRHLAALYASTPLILISGGDRNVLRAAEKLGHAHNLHVMATLSKPFKASEFFPILQNVINTSYQALSRNALNRHMIGDYESIMQAIEQDEFELHYQPQVTINGRRLVGMEALLRWNHPKFGLIYPDTFIPVAENNGLIDELTQWVLRAATRSASQLISDGYNLNVSVNISAANISALTFPEQIRNMLDEHDMEPSRLMVEVTESALMGEVVTSLDILTRMRLKGIRLSIDDFGTGYSSLQQLHRIPFSELKIDRAFVSNMLKDKEARSIVKICIMLSHELGLSSIAEGVEDSETLKMLTDMGCDMAQGFYIASPMPMDSLLDWVNQSNIEH